MPVMLVAIVFATLAFVLKGLIIVFIPIVYTPKYMNSNILNCI